MKDINDLDYLSHIPQSNKMTKDKKHKNKYEQTALLKVKDDKCSDEVSEHLSEELPIIEDENNRRDGSDRRKAQQERGRYIESRVKKNRRYKKDVFIVI
jgi:hypothetical protein